MGDLDGSFSDFSSDIDMMTGLKAIGLYVDDGDSPEPRKRGPAASRSNDQRKESDAEFDTIIANAVSEETPPRKVTPPPKPAPKGSANGRASRATRPSQPAPSSGIRATQAVPTKTAQGPANRTPATPANAAQTAQVVATPVKATSETQEMKTPTKQEQVGEAPTPGERQRRKKRKQPRPETPVFERKRSPPKKRRAPKLQPITLADLGMTPPPPAPEKPKSETETETEEVTDEVTDQKSEEKPKPKPKPKPKEAPKPKPKLSFDYLLEDAETPRSNSTETVSDTRESVPNDTLEGRVVSYLELAIQTMKSDLLAELETMLDRADRTESMVNTFVSDLNKTIRRELSFETDWPDYARASLSGFDAYAQGFVQTMTSVQKLKVKYGVDGFDNVRTSKASVAARIPSVQEAYGAGLDALSQEISEVQDLRLQINAKSSETDGRSTVAMRRLADLEVKEIMQKAERDILQTNRARLDYDSISEPQQIDVTHIKRKMTDLLRRLKESSVGDSPTKHSYKRKSIHLTDMVEKLQKMRETYEYQHTVLCDVCSMITAYSRQKKTSPPRPVLRESHVQDFFPDNTQTEVSISKLKSRLETARREQDNCLKKATSIIDEAKRTSSKHKHRSSHRKRHA